jgi:hypothetical protein
MLRKAFADLANDPAFKATAEKSKLDLAFTPGDQLEKMITRITSASPAAVTLAKKITQRGDTAIESKSP